MPRARPEIERFEALYCPEPNSGCWLWTGSTNKGGYPYFKDSRHKTIYAHRWAYEYFVGPIPESLELDHTCVTPSCVNPAHLEPVTTLENVMRSSGVAAINVAKTHCKAGHELAGRNLILIKDGRERLCRACKNAWWLAWSHRRKAAANG